MLEEEVYSHSSPIWSQDFMAAASGGQIPIHTGNTHPHHLTPNLTAQLFNPFFLFITLFLLFLLYHFTPPAVISAPPVARPLYYSISPVSVDPSSCGSVSPARKTASVLEPNPGMTAKPVITQTFAMRPCYYQRRFGNKMTH